MNRLLQLNKRHKPQVEVLLLQMFWPSLVLQQHAPPEAVADPCRPYDAPAQKAATKQGRHQAIMQNRNLLSFCRSTFLDLFELFGTFNLDVGS